MIYAIFERVDVLRAACAIAAVVVTGFAASASAGTLVGPILNPSNGH